MKKERKEKKLAANVTLWHKEHLGRWELYLTGSVITVFSVFFPFPAKMFVPYYFFFFFLHSVLVLLLPFRKRVRVFFFCIHKKRQSIFYIWFFPTVAICLSTCILFILCPFVFPFSTSRYFWLLLPRQSGLFYTNPGTLLLFSQNYRFFTLSLFVAGLGEGWVDGEILWRK